jgi:hypothetical protein
MPTDQRCEVSIVVANAPAGFKGGGTGFVRRDMPWFGVAVCAQPVLHN